MRRFLAGILAAQLAFPVWAAAQQQPVPPGPASAPSASQEPILPGTLKVLILEGQGAINSTERGMATAPVVEVRDQDDHPVEAATVVFRLPPSGPGGFFPGRKASKTVLTNVQGQAMCSGFVPNTEIGRFRIHVTATAGSRMGENDIVQTNTAREFAATTEPPHRKMTWWKWALIGGAGAGVVIGVILATRGGSSTSSNPTITITPGPVTIGGR